MRLIDCDVHVRWRHLEELAKHMAEPWRTRLLTGKLLHPHNGYPNPISTARRDAAPPGGGQPGSDPAFLVEDLVDRYQMERIIVVGESYQLALSNLANADAAAALAAAYNDWLIERWFSHDYRILGSIFVAAQDPELAAREIERVAGHPQFVQVNLGSGLRAPLGQRVYYPIFDAALRHDLPIAVHPLSEGAGIAGPPTPVGHPSHYIEYHTLAQTGLMTHLVSMICEGVFERFPRLKFVIVEGGVAWLPPLLWRLDKNWKGLRSDTPWVKRKPSEYVLDHVRLTTQPLEEPDDPRHLRRLFEMFPAEQILMFSSDYPHWDFDNPLHVMENLPESLRQRIFADNAYDTYRIARAP
jgi:predicted TIM-barrel fold metal-dependent hydrolase